MPLPRAAAHEGQPAGAVPARIIIGGMDWSMSWMLRDGEVALSAAAGTGMVVEKRHGKENDEDVIKLWSARSAC